MLLIGLWFCFFVVCFSYVCNVCLVMCLVCVWLHLYALFLCLLYSCHFLLFVIRNLNLAVATITLYLRCSHLRVWCGVFFGFFFFYHLCLVCKLFTSRLVFLSYSFGSHLLPLLLPSFPSFTSSVLLLPLSSFCCSSVHLPLSSLSSSCL